MKNIFLSLLFASLSINTFAQCNGNFTITSNGRGGDSIKGLSPSDTAASFVYSWTIYNQAHILFTDSGTAQTFYAFDTNGYFNICLHIRDSSGPCTFDTCKTVLITDAVYHPMLDSINIWHIIQNGCAIAPPPGFSPRSGDCDPRSPVIFTGSEVMLDSVNYVPLYSADYTVINPCLFGYLREDTITRRVYFRDVSGNPDLLLYDFSIQLGDSVFLIFPYPYYRPDSGYWRLNNISTVNTPVGIRRVFTLSKNQQPLTWLEGVGCPINPLYLYSGIGYTCGLFNSCTAPYNLMLGDNGPTFLSCYSHGENIYFDTCAFNLIKDFGGGNCMSQLYDSCDYFGICGAIHNISAFFSFDISPNPAVTEISVQLAVEQSSKFSLCVRNLQGKQVITEKDLGWLNAGQHNTVINLQGISSGFYLVECKTDEGSAYKKLVVW